MEEIVFIKLAVGTCKYFSLNSLKLFHITKLLKHPATIALNRYFNAHTLSAGIDANKYKIRECRFRTREVSFGIFRAESETLNGGMIAFYRGQPFMKFFF